MLIISILLLSFTNSVVAAGDNRYPNSRESEIEDTCRSVSRRPTLTPFKAN